MFQKIIDWIKSLFGPKRIPQPAHDVPDIPVGEASGHMPPTAPQSDTPAPVESGKVTGYRLTTLNRWKSIHLIKTAEHEQMALSAVKYKTTHYDQVEAATGIPWYAVAAWDMREESFNHTKYLGNGDPLNKKSVHVPAGRGPFATWYAGAIDALTLEGFSKIKHWDIVTTLIESEIYNGGGYKARGIPSPYVYAGTSVQVPGKFVKDRVFDPNYIDTQPSCAGLFLALKLNHGVDLLEA